MLSRNEMLNVDVGNERMSIRNIDSLTLFAAALHFGVTGTNNLKLMRFTSEAYRHSQIQSTYQKLLTSSSREQSSKIIINIIEQLSKPELFYKFINSLFSLVQLFRITNAFCGDHFIDHKIRVEFFDCIFNFVLLDHHILTYVDDATKLNELLKNIIDKDLDLEFILKLYDKVT